MPECVVLKEFMNNHHLNMLYLQIHVLLQVHNMNHQKPFYVIKMKVFLMIDLQTMHVQS